MGLYSLLVETYYSLPYTLLFYHVSLYSRNERGWMVEKKGDLSEKPQDLQREGVKDGEIRVQKEWLHDEDRCTPPSFDTADDGGSVSK